MLFTIQAQPNAFLLQESSLTINRRWEGSRNRMLSQTFLILSNLLWTFLSHFLSLHINAALPKMELTSAPTQFENKEMLAMNTLWNYKSRGSPQVLLQTPAPGAP